MTIDMRYYGGTNSIPTQFCQKCGKALGTSIAIDGGLNFHPWCAPSVTKHHGAWSEDCNKANLEIDQLKAKLAAAEAEVERLTPHQNCGSHWDGCWRAGGHHSCAIAEVERLTWMLREVYGDWVDGESYESWLADLARRWEEHRADH